MEATSFDMHVQSTGPQMPGKDIRLDYIIKCASPMIKLKECPHIPRQKENSKNHRYNIIFSFLPIQRNPPFLPLVHPSPSLYHPQ